LSVTAKSEEMIVDFGLNPNLFLAGKQEIWTATAVPTCRRDSTNGDQTVDFAAATEATRKTCWPTSLTG
jgi:hypothetical protein